MARPFELVVNLLGVTWRVDRYGFSLFDTARYVADQDAAEHDCGRDHPDGPCDLDDEVGAFREDDLLTLLVRARDGEHPVELMGEFIAGVRADPE